MKKTKLAIDLLLLVLFILLFFEHATGTSVHVIFALILTAGIVLHLVQRRRQFAAALRKRPGARLRNPLPGILNLFLIAAFTLTIFSGIVNAVTLSNTTAVEGNLWEHLHTIGASLCFIGTISHAIIQVRKRKSSRRTVNNPEIVAIAGDQT